MSFTFKVLQTDGGGILECSIRTILRKLNCILNCFGNCQSIRVSSEEELGKSEYCRAEAVTCAGRRNSAKEEEDEENGISDAQCRCLILEQA